MGERASVLWAAGDRAGVMVLVLVVRAVVVVVVVVVMVMVVVVVVVMAVVVVVVVVVMVVVGSAGATVVGGLMMTKSIHQCGWLHVSTVVGGASPSPPPPPFPPHPPAQTCGASVAARARCRGRPLPGRTVVDLRSERAPPRACPRG